jgi:hypothetical protein
MSIELLENVLKNTNSLKSISISFVPKIDLYITVLQSCLNINKGVISDKYLDLDMLNTILPDFLSNINMCQIKIEKKFENVSVNLNSSNSSNSGSFRKYIPQSPRKSSSLGSSITEFFSSSNSKKNISYENPEESLNEILEVENKRLDELIKKITLCISNSKPNNLVCSNIQQLQIISNVKLPLEVDHNSSFEKPHDPLYGGDFKSKLALEFKVPNLNVCNKTFDGIKIHCVCTDQEWGGTGQCNVRYFVNDKWFNPGFYINREKTLDKNYSFIIKKEDIKAGDTVTIWLCCPGWNGWKAILEYIYAELLYINK